MWANVCRPFTDTVEIVAYLVSNQLCHELQNR
jgi:hypothetical protein